MATRKLKVLAELRPTAEGYAGIPQETRLVFSSLLDLPDLETTGLINSQNRMLRRADNRRRRSQHSAFRRLDNLAKFIISTKYRYEIGVLRYLHDKIGVPALDLHLLLRNIFRGIHELDSFSGQDFPDFIWSGFFAPSLSLENFDKIVGANYRTLRPSWEAMQRTGHFAFGRPHYPRLDTEGYDVFLAQMPFPGTVSKGTHTLIRYHDGISVFKPHTVPLAFARKAHVQPLRLHAPHASFVCTSAASRDDLLKLCPEVEPRAHVIHNMVADNYFEETTTRARVIDIVTKHLDPATSPSFRRLRDQQRYFAELGAGDFEYILMVSTLEPRKNHLRLIQAWEMLRGRHHSTVRLIFVGSLGWQTKPILKAMKPWQDRGYLLHLSSVPAPSLRLLYNGARCVVCPSVAEGFDQSGVEAMLCGGVTAASDIPVHREVFGEAAAYFNTYSVEQQAETILSLIADTPDARDRRARLRDIGMRFAQRYRQKQVAGNWQALFDRLRDLPAQAV